MNHDSHHQSAGDRPRGLPRPGGVAFNIGLAGLLGIGAYFLWTEHRAHLGSILIWGLLLACPLMHFFMHGSHGGHDDHRPPDERTPPDHSGHAGTPKQEN
ncbi:DUF2933 domain-containing protein [Pseudomonas aeruginosa]|jgi:hypothetical protein|uniref:DUF2933 domain-containing protein n=1 Tax=Gammaproteobacteria TaxID=1236 RepID=UPI0009A3063C|nr:MULTISPECIES: DUF2933 domain-containing protein [Gammaproteobacteria]EIZ0539863.1 DUF2933 domain-containing protein [Pseudomonas aeruginosa]EKV4127230.1 DUF2933 domain-containing protein [Pseudomonas aeruginosa]EKW0411108.1 DUF2933 domain-containing protein [Pseudomonas aeruginosa]EKW1417676.1 DUF2933 domain-containing protein [Pseudomonas aeruginosa]EKW1532562.1 DUF2933 domain-containing protein [Pseudomonas aeruginosa]